MKSISIRLMAGACSCAVLSGLVPAAHAQEAEQQNDLVISKVTVTAQRREESLQSVPVTVTAFSGADIELKGIDDVQSLVSSTPGISMDAFPKTAPRPFIRGIGSGNQSGGADPSSVAFVDGVYLGRGPMLSVDIFDVERVEVLKGPQGTLWGKNVVGGAVHYITQKPVDYFEAKAQLTIADYGQKDARFVLNTPVTDNLSTRLSLSSIKNDGFRTNTNTGGPLDDDERISGRFHALYDVSDQTSILFSIDGTKDEAAGPARFNLAPSYEDLDNPDTANPDYPGFLNRETWGTKLEVNSSALGWADLTAYVSYRDLDNSTLEDFDGTDPAGNEAADFPLPGVQVIMIEQAESLSAEARLATTFDGPFNWVAGAFILQDTIDRERESQYAMQEDVVDTHIAHNVTDSLGVFVDGRYQFTDEWGVFGGIRLTDEQKKYEIRQLVGDSASPTVAFSTYGDPGISDEQQWTWRAGTDYQLTPNIFLFGTVATGFKSGAFEEEPSEETARLATEPETVINYEVGAKTDFWDGRGRANISIFHTEYSDLQTIQAVDDASLPPPALTSIVTDTGDATIEGIETELQWLPTDNLRLGLLYTYLDATFDEFFETDEILADGTAVISDLSGNRLSRTPEHSVSLNGVYRTETYDWGTLSFGVDLNYQSKIYDDNSNNEIESREPRTLLDAFVTYEPNDHLTLKLWGRNLTDEVYRVHQAEVAGGLFVQYGAPKQVGLTATLEF